MCWWVSFVCKPGLDVTVECRYLNYECKWGLSVKCSKQYEWLQNAQWRKTKWSHVITAHSIISMLKATSMIPVKLSTGSQNIIASVLPRITNFGLYHGCARVAHCVTALWRNFSHYHRSLRQYDIWFTCSEHREALTAAPTADVVHKQAFRVEGWST